MNLWIIEEVNVPNWIYLVDFINVTLNWVLYINYRCNHVLGLYRTNNNLLTFRCRAWYGCINISRMITECALGIPITVRSNTQTRYSTFCYLSYMRTCSLMLVYTLHNICLQYYANNTWFHAWCLKVNSTV